MSKRLKIDEALSSKINTLPEDFMKYLEGCEKRFLKEMQEHDFKLVKALPNKKIINGITVSSYVFGNMTQDMIQGIQDVLRVQNIRETTIVTSGYGVSKLSVRYSELSKELSICYQDADRLQITKDDYRFYSTSKNGYALEFYPSYKKKCDGSDCTGGVNIRFKSGKKVPFSTAFASVLCSENNAPIGWFVREFYKYLSTIPELYLFKDFQREADFLNDFSVYESKAINLSLEDIFKYRTKDDWFHAHLAKINGHRYTIEFVYDEEFKTYKVAQMFLACNKEAFLEDVEYLDELLLPNLKKEMEQIHVPVNSEFNALQVQLPENFLWLQNGESIYSELKENHRLLYNDVKYWVRDDIAAVYTVCINKVDYIVIFGMNGNKFILFSVCRKDGKKVAKSVSNQIEKLIQDIQPAS